MSSNIIILRGLLEKIIDERLTEQFLTKAHDFFEKLRPAVSKREDAIFGYIIGETIARSFASFTKTVNRDFTEEEIDEVFNIIERRSLEIRRRIMETST